MGTHTYAYSITPALKETSPSINIHYIERPYPQPPNLPKKDANFYVSAPLRAMYI